MMGVALRGVLLEEFLPKNPAAYGVVNHKNWRRFIQNCELRSCTK